MCEEEGRKSSIDIIINEGGGGDEPNDDDDDDDVVDNIVVVPSRQAQISFYVASKILAWVGRARIAAWFRMAFQLPSSAETSRAATPSQRSGGSGKTTFSDDESIIASPSPDLDQIEARKRSLTLEPNYQSVLCRDRFACGKPGEFPVKAVPTMLRSASTVLNVDYCHRLHKKLLDDTAKFNRSKSDQNIDLDEAKITEKLNE